MTRVKGALVRILVSCVVIGVGIAFMSAETPTVAKRPSTVPSEYHATPFGYFHPSCVKQLEHGDTLEPRQFAIQHHDGSLEAMPDCNYPHFDTKGTHLAWSPGTDSRFGRKTVPKRRPIRAEKESANLA